MSVQEELTELIGMLADHEEGCELIDSRARGWKSANKSLRKTTLILEKRLKALRKSSMDLEKA